MMLGKVPGNMKVIRPMKRRRDRRLHGHRADAKQFIKMVHPRFGAAAEPADHHLRACGSTQVEHPPAIRESALGAGATTST